MGYETIAKEMVGGLRTQKAVNQFNLQGLFINTFPSCAEAARSLGKDGKKEGPNIAKVCRGKAKTAYGYYWEFVI